MKKKYLILTIIILTIITFSFYSSKVQPVIENKKTLTNSINGNLSINIETEAGSGIYQELKNNDWTIDGYVFNTELSRCKNGSEVSWDDSNNRVLVSSITSDKCYVYFDISFASHIKSLYTDGTNGLYYHNSDLVNGAQDSSYRYSGENPDNYVCFGSDDAICPTDNLYRIIGVFGDQVKLVKGDYANANLLGTDGAYRQSYTPSETYRGNLSTLYAYNWDNTSNTINTNWEESDLNEINLNTNYLNNIGAKWESLISSSTWYIEGVENDAVSSFSFKKTYDAEMKRENAKTYNAKIGMLYLSEFLYALPSTYWNNFYQSIDFNVRIANWMNMGFQNHLLTKTFDYTDGTFIVSPNSAILSFASIPKTRAFVYNRKMPAGIRPTFMLNKSVKLTGGTGEKNDPYRLLPYEKGNAKYILPQITNASYDIQSTSITINVTASKGTSNKIKYFYSDDAGFHYSESNSNTYTFSGLKENQLYNIKIKVQDEYGYYSDIVNYDLTTKTTLSSYIKSLYTTQGANNLYHHDGTITATIANEYTGVAVGDVIDSEDGSYRYAGSSTTTNNYVCFGQDDETGAYASGWCDENNLYRIIGVFNDPMLDEDGNSTSNTEARVKLIKATLATSTLLGTDGVYYDDSSYRWSGQNHFWSYSALNQTNLNKNYLTNIGVKWNEMIDKSIWYVGGMRENYVFWNNNAKIVYNYELGKNKNTSTSYEPVSKTKAGLMYVSEYLYGASPMYWTYSGWDGTLATTSEKDYKAAKADNWMYSGFNEWTISPDLSDDNNYRTFIVSSEGNIAYKNVNYSGSGVRPTFSLKSSVTFAGGTGTETDPYRID